MRWAAVTPNRFWIETSLNEKHQRVHRRSTVGLDQADLRVPGAGGVVHRARMRRKLSLAHESLAHASLRLSIAGLRARPRLNVLPGYSTLRRLGHDGCPHSSQRVPRALSSTATRGLSSVGQPAVEPVRRVITTRASERGCGGARGVRKRCRSTCSLAALALGLVRRWSVHVEAVGVRLPSFVGFNMLGGWPEATRKRTQEGRCSRRAPLAPVCAKYAVRPLSAVRPRPLIFRGPPGSNKCEHGRSLASDLLHGLRRRPAPNA